MKSAPFFHCGSTFLPKRFLSSVSSLLLFVPSAFAADGTWTQTANTIYSNTSNWMNGVVASGTGATMTITNSGPTIVVDSNVTIGALTGAWGTGSSMNLSGTTGASLNFASSSSTPSLSIATLYSRYDYVTNLNISGSQGLNYIGASNVLVLKSGVTWTGFSGTFTITPPGNGDGGILYAQAAGVLPGADLTMTPGYGGNAYAKSKLVLNIGADQTIGALNSTIVGSNTAYISSFTSSSILTGGSPSGSGTNGYSTLTIGLNNNSGTFRGKIGTGYTTAGAEDTAAHQLHITKTGTGTQTFSGANIYSGTTTISAGTLLVTGTHAATIVSGSDTGRYVVGSAGTLGGTGTIMPSTTVSGTIAMIAVSGTLAPGVSGTNSSIGTLTLDGTNTVKPLLLMESGGKLAIDLGAGTTSDKVAITNGGTGDVVSNSNTINFNDTTTGALTSGTYVLIDGDASTTYSGLTVDGSNVITAGLSIGSGLGAYPGSQLKVVGNDIVLNLIGATAQPVALSFNMKGAAHTGMTSSDLAGPTGARFAKWNNFNITTTSGSLSAIVDSNGAAVAPMTVSFAGGNVGSVFNRNTPSPSNDTRLFDTVLDQYDTTQSTVTVTGVPYVTYDVYFYMLDDGTARGGRFTAGGTTYYLRGGVGNPTSSGSGYVQSTDTTFTSGSNTKANYVKFTGVSGSTLTATFVAVNEGDSVQRLKMPGFQIVASVPPPNSAPSAPTSVAITATNLSAVTLQWNAANTATQYQIFRSTTAGSFDFNNPLATAAAPATSYNDTTAVNGTTYYYVIRAVNGVGSSTSSTEVSTPPPNLDSVAVGSPVLWPGGSTTITWAIPNAASLTINSGTGAQSYPTTGSLPITLNSTTTYTFAATNAQGTTSKDVLVTVVPKPATRDSLWQWSVQITGFVSPETNDYPRAFLYIPPNVTTVRGVIIGQHNMLEEPVMEHSAVRQGLADANMAAIWVTPAFDGGFNFTANPNTPVIFQQMMNDLAVVSGYAELSKTPVVWIGHSAMSEAPYFFAAWDTEHSVATGEPKRCAAAISLQGYYPGRHNADQPTYANSDLAGTPIMYIEGEYADANGRATNTLSFRNSTPGTIISFFGEPGGGHFDWNDRNCEYIGMYLRKLGQYRLPATAAADGTATLQTINTSTQGWLADRWRKGQNPTANPAAVGSYTGNTSEAFWYFDQEHAETTNNAYLPVKTTYQLVGYTQNGTLVDQIESHLQVEPPFTPDPAGDGLTFKLGTAFLSSVPATSSRLTGWTGLPVGSAIGHSNNGPILINRVCGPVEMLSPDTFAVRFGREGTNNIYGQTRSRDIVLTAVHPGDSAYVRAVQQSQIRIPLPLTSGAAQAITFPAIADQVIDTTSINLNATTTGTATYAGAQVSFYVREGPAKENGSTLEFTTLPPRTKFPVKVTVVATQYGRSIAPLLQTATPVTRTFWIQQTAVNYWRYDKFGTYANTGTAADTADPDGDGRSNLLEYSTGTDPLRPDSGSAGEVGQNIDGTRLTLTFDRIADSALTYIVEASNDLDDATWTGIWSSTGALNVAGPVTATDTELIANHPKRFLRLRVTY